VLRRLPRGARRNWFVIDWKSSPKSDHVLKACEEQGVQTAPVKSLLFGGLSVQCNSAIDSLAFRRRLQGLGSPRVKPHLFFSPARFERGLFFAEAPRRKRQRAGGPQERVLTTSNRKPPLRRSEQMDNTMFTPFYSRSPGVLICHRADQDAIGCSAARLFSSISSEQARAVLGSR
jgi:hypothetical protein